MPAEFVSALTPAQSRFEASNQTQATDAKMTMQRTPMWFYLDGYAWAFSGGRRQVGSLIKA
jgi:hypothetical protein